MPRILFRGFVLRRVDQTTVCYLYLEAPGAQDLGGSIYLVGGSANVKQTVYKDLGDPMPAAVVHDPLQFRSALAHRHRHTKTAILQVAVFFAVVFQPESSLDDLIRGKTATVFVDEYGFVVLCHGFLLTWHGLPHGQC